MSVWGRMRQLQMAEEQEPNGQDGTQTSPSSTLVSVNDTPPAVLRLRAVLAELTSFITSKGSNKQKRMAFVMRRIANDVCEELQDSDPETVAAYFDQMGSVISWIGTGNNDNLSPSLQELFMPRTEGIQAAITSGKVEDSLHYDRETGELEKLGPEPEELVTPVIGINSELS